jgi:uncharacterized repeat protein (TIGR03806 family)
MRRVREMLRVTSGASMPGARFIVVSALSIFLAGCPGSDPTKNSPPTQISIADAQVNEGDSGTTLLSFDVTLSAAAAEIVTVDFATNAGTALAGEDYLRTTGTVSFPAGVTTQTVNVPINGDTVTEPDESFTIALGNASANATIARLSATGTIVNDDGQPSISIANASAPEGNSGGTILSFTATLSNPSTQPVSAAWATADGTATAGSDYVAASGTVDFAPGETSQTVSVALTGDTVVEANESFSVTLSAPVNATLGSATATGTIQNDDVPPVAITIANASVAEGDTGTRQLTFTLALSDVAAGPVTVDYSTPGGSATPGSDFVAAAGTVTFPGGTTTKTIDVTINGDTTIEPDEQFTVVLANPSANATIAIGSATGTILNDDAPIGTPQLSIASAQITEGNAGTKVLNFSVALSAAAAASVTVSYATTDGTATAGSDYAAASGTLTFSPGVTSLSVLVTINGDTLNEPDEQFQVSLSAPSANATIAGGVATGTITNDDPQPLVSIAAPAVADEGNAGTKAFTFNVSLSTASSRTITVAWATANGTATVGSDYVAGSGVATFAPGATAQTVSVTVNGDTTFEPDETFTATLSNPTNATLGTASATATIRNDDAQPSISIASPSAVTEGNSGTKQLAFTVTLSNPSYQAITATYATTNGTASGGTDYQTTNGTVSFAAGVTTQSINVTINGDTAFEQNETFTITLASPTNATIGAATGTGTINNDDVQPAISVSSASVAEGNSGTTTLNFTVTLSNASYQTITAAWATADGTAAAGSDYVAASGTVSFAPGVTSQTIGVAVNGDATVESDETFTVALSAPANATIATGTATGTILNDDGAAVFGLDSRPGNSSCIAPARPTGGTTISIQTVFAGAGSFTRPVKLLQAPGDGSRWFVVEQNGRVKVFNAANPTPATTYLDWNGRLNAGCRGNASNCGEEGLLGMAFHPNFPAVKEVFLSYTADSPNGNALLSKIVRVTLDNVVTPSVVTEQTLLTVDQPYSNHNGGNIDFGPDGYLYIGLGDGGSGGDPQNHAQDTTDLLGSMLRIDVNGTGAGYNIPADNPFAGNSKCGPAGNAQNCPELFAWGLRNPWRWSFDNQTGQLWAGDVGQDLYEEVDRIQKGGNYGWRCREGLHAYNSSGCPSSGLIDPVAEYDHSQGSAIVGGYVYRGSAIPALVGRLVFADDVSGIIWALKDNGAGGYTIEELLNTSNIFSSFGQGVDGELYLVDLFSGQNIRKIVAGSAPVDTIPANLSATGCVNGSNPILPAAGLVPYTVNAPFWSDGVSKERWLALPDGSTITINSTSNDWDLPNGSILMKLFRTPSGTPFETRLLMRHPDGVWAGYTYEWNANLTDATRVIGGKTKTLVNGQSWIYPSEGQCMRCHTQAAGFSLGPETAQLNGNFLYPSTGRTSNQLATLDHIGLFSVALSPPPAGQPVLPDPTDSARTLNERARAYLHTNCAQCHRPGGPTPSNMDLRYTTALAATNACNAAPQYGDLGLTTPKLISPGAAAQSVIPARMNRRDTLGMPPLGSVTPDATGVTLVQNWINGLSSCN